MLTMQDLIAVCKARDAVLRAKAGPSAPPNKDWAKRTAARLEEGSQGWWMKRLADYPDLYQQAQKVPPLPGSEEREPPQECGPMSKRRKLCWEYATNHTNLRATNFSPEQHFVMIDGHPVMVRTHL